MNTNISRVSYIKFNYKVHWIHIIGRYLPTLPTYLPTIGGRRLLVQYSAKLPATSNSIKTMTSNNFSYNHHLQPQARTYHTYNNYIHNLKHPTSCNITFKINTLYYIAPLHPASKHLATSYPQSTQHHIQHHNF